MPKQLSPKAVFFRKNGNTIAVNNKELDIIESKVYKYLDNWLSKKFEVIQSEKIPDFNDSTLFYYISIMAATLYYRLPSSKLDLQSILEANFSDNISDIWLKNQVVSAFNLKLSEDDKCRFLKCIVPFVGLNLFGQNNFEPNMYYSTCDTDTPRFILSDWPIINRNAPINFTDIASLIIFPLTSKRLYYHIKGNFTTLGIKKVYAINLILAIQAERYFGCEDKEFLESVVEFYKDSHKYKINLVNARNELFDIICD